MTRVPSLSLHGIGQAMVAPFGSLVLVLLSAAPPALSGVAPMAPLWGLMAVHAWAMSRPDLLGFGTAALLGLVYDALSDLPLGLTGLAFLLARWLPVGPLAWLHGQRFASLWLGFLAVAAIVFALLYAGRALEVRQLFTPAPMLLQAAVTVALYPAIAAAVFALSRRLGRERGA